MASCIWYLVSDCRGGLSASADGAIIVTNVGSNTQTVEYVIGGNLLASSNPTVVLRYGSNNWHYRIGKINTSEMNIQRYNPGFSGQVWRSNTGTVLLGDKVRVSPTGTAGAVTFRIWVNDVKVTSGASGSLTDTDATVPAGTEAGFRYGFSSSGGTYNFRNFRAHGALLTP